MAIDAYQPCPCGSGKKLKFCCSDLVGEMTKVQRLQDNDQFRLALQTLEHLDQAHPNNPWVATTRASILLQDDNPVEGARVLERFLQAHPDHVFGIALYALARFAASGFDDARQAVYRAFQRAAHAYPDVVGGLAMGIATSMLSRGHFLSARAHLVLTMRLIPEAERESVFVRLLEFEGDRQIPYPLRSVHALAPYAGDESTRQDAERARRLADIGCWGASAQLYTQLAEKDPDSSAVWKNLGLCRAWNGDDARAAEALHRAARLEGDCASAVELETVAQLLDQNSTTDCVTVEIVEYPVQSVSKLLTLLDGSKRLARIPISPSADQQETAATGMYLVLDRECGEDETFQTAGAHDVPNVLGHIGVFDAVADGEENFPSHALLSAYQGEHIVEARALFVEAAGSEIGPEQAPADEDMRHFESIPREHVQVLPRMHFPKSVSVTTRDRLMMDRWRETAISVWPKTPLAALGGKTAAEAVGNPEQKLALTAALYTFDALCESNQYTLDLPALAESLKVDLPPTIQPEESVPLNSFSSMRLNLLAVSQLPDDRLVYTLNRALLIHHSRFLYDVLQEVVRRPSCLEKVDLNRVYSTLADIARDHNHLDEALEWTRKGVEHARSQKDSFDAIFRWELRELVTRLRNPEDPELGRVVAHMRDYYGPKLPNFEAYLRAILNAFNVATPESSADALFATAGAAPGTAGGLWTPDAAAASPGGEKKLWLPGQQ